MTKPKTQATEIKMEKPTKEETREFAIDLCGLFNQYDALARESRDIQTAMFMLEISRFPTAEKLAERLDSAHRRICNLLQSKKSEIMERLGEPRWFSLPVRRYKE